MSDTQQKPRTTPGGEPEPETGQPVDRFHPDRGHGERQDGPGAGPVREEASEATPVGSRAALRRGERQGIGSRDPFEGHRGDPAGLTGGAATGSGSGAGGGGAGEQEEPGVDSAGGGGRQRSG